MMLASYSERFDPLCSVILLSSVYFSGTESQACPRSDAIAVDILLTLPNINSFFDSFYSIQLTPICRASFHGVLY